MYKLYFIPGACSLATQVILRELNLPVTLINKASVINYQSINPTGTVPVLESEELRLKEGAGIIFHLLDKYPNRMMPMQEEQRSFAIENILFANASMHPAYSKLFFINQFIDDTSEKKKALEAAASRINELWQVVELRLGNKLYLGGDEVSAADILLAVYQRWAEHFPVDVTLGAKAQAMVESVHAMDSFKASLVAEAELS